MRILKKILLVAVAVPLAALLLLFGWLLYRAPGPFPDYAPRFVKAPAGDAAKAPASTPLMVGVAKQDITPDLSKYDKFVDKDEDNKYDPSKGDYFEDTNHNGKLDAVWIAGFGNNRPAKGVHDPLWARAIAFENNGVRVVMVTLDGIGIFNNHIVEMRKMLDPALKVDHLVVSSLHNHETPDTMGIWSIGLEKPYWRFDYGHMELVKRKVVEAAAEAVENLQPAEAFLGQAAAGPEGYVDDSRIPLVYDNVIRIARFVQPGTENTIATMLVWGNHPETLGGKNPLLTSDFADTWRTGVEGGVPEPLGAPGVGGMCLYFQGQVGGLMTQLHTTVPHRDGTKTFREDSFEKSQALGDNLALLTLKTLRDPAAMQKMTDNRVAVAVNTYEFKPQFKFAIPLFLGIVHPGWFWGRARTEVNALRVGGIEMLTVPGEVYPEICEGGVEAPDGADFGVQPVEVPPLRSQMGGQLTMIIGLANDEIGYIVPRSQWDTEPPFAYGKKDGQYGEENSFGPDSAPALHKAASEVIAMLHGAVE